MRAHWDTWFTKAYIQALAQRHVEIVRLPIGDWTTVAYGPYIGCMDGAAEKIDWFMDTAAKYGIKVLLDVHAIKDSQNGFDNSGKATNVEWTDETHFKHWSISAGNWMGNFNLQSYKYDSINWDNVTWAVNNCVAIMNRWGNHPAMYALEPVNEPWWNSDFSVLFDYYRQVRTAMKTINPNIIFVFHDAFNPWYDWNSLFADDDMENVIMDNHSYMAWWERKAYVGKYCDDYGAQIRGYAGHIKYPIWIGEWSLATDVCAFWLGGFNDSNTAY